MKSLKSNLILVPKLLKKLKRDYGFIPYIGVEVEFYLKNQSYGELNENEQQHFFDILQNKNIKLTGEKGQDQFEFELGPSASILNLIQEIITWRQFIKDVAYENQLLANFKPKPFLNSYGSAMHFNISLQNKTGETVFLKEIIPTTINMFNILLVEY